MKPSKKTLYEFFETFAKERGDDVFLLDETQVYTVKQALSAAKSLAKQMRDAGVKQGDFVAVQTKRTVKNILLFYALQFLNGVAVLFEPREKGKRMNFMTDGEAFFVGEQRILLDFSPKETKIGFPSDSRQTSIVIFTSGSTGESKAVQLSQYNFINNSLDTQSIGGYRKDDINILIVPIHHVFGLALIMTAVVTQHAVFVPSEVDFDYILDCMERYGVTRLNGVPSMYLAMAERKGTRKISTLNCGLIAGAPCSKEQFLKIEHDLGITLVTVYGMSECVGISCGNYKDNVDDRCDNVGRIYSMNEVKIASDGEILVKGPTVTAGYLTEQGSVEVTDADGWLHTGDLGELDEKGFLHIGGRKKDIIIRNGNNLSSVAIEQKLLRLNGVKDVAVVGISDPREGEVPCAMIVTDGTAVSDAFLLTVLNKLEMPKHYAQVEKIPLTASGKADKQKITKFFERSE